MLNLEIRAKKDDATGSDVFDLVGNDLRTGAERRWPLDAATDAEAVSKARRMLADMRINGAAAHEATHHQQTRKA